MVLLALTIAHAIDMKWNFVHENTENGNEYGIILKDFISSAKWYPTLLSITWDQNSACI